MPTDIVCRFCKKRGETSTHIPGQYPGLEQSRSRQLAEYLIPETNNKTEMTKFRVNPYDFLCNCKKGRKIEFSYVHEGFSGNIKIRIVLSLVKAGLSCQERTLSLATFAFVNDIDSITYQPLLPSDIY